MYQQFTHRQIIDETVPLNEARVQSLGTCRLSYERGRKKPQAQSVARDER